MEDGFLKSLREGLSGRIRRLLLLLEENGVGRRNCMILKSRVKRKSGCVNVKNLQTVFSKSFLNVKLTQILALNGSLQMACCLDG